MAIKVNINGEMREPQEATVSIFDHGFLFGDSVYEVVRTYRGRPFLLEDHLLRLEQSAKAISLEIDISHGEWKERIEQTLAAAENDESLVRMIVTRGVGEPRIDPATCKKRTYIILVQPLVTYPHEFYQEGVKIEIVSTRKYHSAALNPQIKSGNYLSNVLALMEAKKSDAHEGIMLNSKGMVAEGTTSNIFAVRQGVLSTPSLKAGILEGITRGIVFELARELEIPLEERDLAPRDLCSSDEVFITSTTREIMPVRQVGEKEIQGECPGSMTKKLSVAFKEKVEDYLRATA